MRIHGLRSDLVREIGRLNLPDLTPDHLIQMGIHGVTVELARKAKERLGEALTASKLIDIAITGHWPG
jgi:hypothetical protein